MSINPLYTLVFVMPLAFGAGYVLQRVIFDRVIGVDPAFQIVATFGLAIVIQQGLYQHYTADTRGLDVGALETSSIKVNDTISIGWLPLITLLCAVAVLAGLALFMKRTRLGRAFRATSDDPDAARHHGDPRRAHLRGGHGARRRHRRPRRRVGGSPVSFDPFLGPQRLIFAFEAVIIGGLGSLWGTLAGGIILGVSQSIGRQIDPQWGELAGHLVFLTVLVFRPTGLFGKGQMR